MVRKIAGALASKRRRRLVPMLPGEAAKLATDIANVDAALRPFATIEDLIDWVDVELLACQFSDFGECHNDWQETVDKAFPGAAAFGLAGMPVWPKTGKRAECEPALVNLLSWARNQIAADGSLTGKPVVDGLVEHDRKILDWLSVRKAAIYKQAAIAEAIDVSAKTVGVRLNALKSRRLVQCPNGPRSGYQITDAGLSAISAIPGTG